MQTVGRRHQFLSGRRAHHDVRVGIEGNHDRLTAMGTGITDKRFDEFLVSTVHTIENADGDGGSTQVLALIKCIGSNDASLVRLAREKDTRELASGQHHRTPPIACGNTCSMTKRPLSMRASALSPPSSTNANGAFEASKSASARSTGMRRPQSRSSARLPGKSTRVAPRAAMGSRAKPAADSGESSSTA